MKVIKKILKYDIPFIFIFLLPSYVLGLLYYDSTRGLDFNRYIRNVQFFYGNEIELQDSQGSLYFFILSKFVTAHGKLDPQAGNISLNNSIQLFNFLLFVIGLVGLYYLLLSYKISTVNKYIALSILCFFPSAFYFRLTMKPEAMAFAIFPWSIFLINNYFKNKSYKAAFWTSLLVSVLITLKASIAGMVLLSFIFLYSKEILDFKKNFNIIVLTSIFSTLLTFLNFKLTNMWLFQKPYNPVVEWQGKWDNVAPLKFFISLDLKNLFLNPYKHLHSDSLVSITLLDTLSDYFTFFWNHKEHTNYIAYGRIEYTNNFLIKSFLPQYISILFTIFLYFAIISILKNKKPMYKLVSLPLFGILTLIINSLGFPSKNFDPTTGDLFKVHYYSFLLAISFYFVIIYSIEKLGKYKYLTFVIIPIFLLTMGFPKEYDVNINQNLKEKFQYSEVCKISNKIFNISCNN